MNSEPSPLHGDQGILLFSFGDFSKGMLQLLFSLALRTTAELLKVHKHSAPFSVQDMK